MKHSMLAAFRLAASQVNTSFEFLDQYGLAAIEQQPGYFIIEPIDTVTEDPGTVEGVIDTTAGDYQFKLSRPHSTDDKTVEGRCDSLEALADAISEFVNLDQNVLGASTRLAKTSVSAALKGKMSEIAKWCRANYPDVDDAIEDFEAAVSIADDIKFSIKIPQELRTLASTIYELEAVSSRLVKVADFVVTKVDPHTIEFQAGPEQEQAIKAVLGRAYRMQFVDDLVTVTYH